MITTHPSSPLRVASEPRNLADADVESAFGRMTLDELSRMQDVLFEQLRTGLPSNQRITKVLEGHDADVATWFRGGDSRGEAVKVVMLLGALAVAIAWQTHRHMPAPTPRIQDAIARVREDHVYMLPIPRTDPCFCGSGGLFRACHGRPPIAAPAV